MIDFFVFSKWTCLKILGFCCNFTECSGRSVLHSWKEGEQRENEFLTDSRLCGFEVTELGHCMETAWIVVLYYFRLSSYLDVSHSVVVEVGTGGEPFSAHSTLVRFFAAVDAPVGVQRARSRETLIADGTHVRFFACESKQTTRILFIVYCLLLIWILLIFVSSRSAAVPQGVCEPPIVRGMSANRIRIMRAINVYTYTVVAVGIEREFERNDLIIQKKKIIINTVIRSSATTAE